MLSEGPSVVTGPAEHEELIDALIDRIEKTAAHLYGRFDKDEVRQQLAFAMSTVSFLADEDQARHGDDDLVRRLRNLFHHLERAEHADEEATAEAFVSLSFQSAKRIRRSVTAFAWLNESFGEIGEEGARQASAPHEASPPEAVLWVGSLDCNTLAGPQLRLAWRRW
jgi:hypothetical protein